MTVDQEIIFNIDRSGSMSGKEEDTIGGINTMLKELKKNKKENEIINISLKFFDNEEYLKYRHVNLEDLKPLEISDFKPRGQTGLYDSMGNSLRYLMEKKIKDPECFKKCMIVTTTDGLENCSKYFTAEYLKKMIKEAKEKYNIECIYLGANQDAILEAQKFGIDAGLAINFNETEENTQAVYRCAAAAAFRSRTNEEISFTNVERQASVDTGPYAPRISRQIAQNMPPRVSRQSTIS